MIGAENVFPRSKFRLVKGVEHHLIGTRVWWNQYPPSTFLRTRAVCRVFGGGSALAIAQAAIEDELDAIRHGLEALNNGDCSIRLPEHWNGTAGKVSKLFNELAQRNGTARRNGADAGAHADDRSIKLLEALLAVKKGNASTRLPLDWPGVWGKVADTFNDVVELNSRKQQELARLSRVVGKEGKLKQRASLGDATGFWKDSSNPSTR